MHDLSTPEGVVAHMSEATSGEDWRRRTKEVKAANDGDYPSFWYEKVVLTGLMGKILEGQTL